MTVVDVPVATSPTSQSEFVLYSGPARSCCNSQWCCEDEYFSQLASLPCGNHDFCRDMGYGNFCCPQGNKGNETLPSVCCNEDPNPPPSTTTSKSLLLTNDQFETSRNLFDLLINLVLTYSV